VHTESDVACPLCHSGPSRRFAEVRGAVYDRCDVCALTYLLPAHHVSPEQELRRYEEHQNDPADERYRAFLAPLAEALAARLPAGAEGLDYGSGPGPALPAMLEERGLRVALYDPYFAPETAVLARQYTFIACSETAEHFAHPAEEFGRFDRLLRPGGWLGVMTLLLEEDAAFVNSHYQRDPTHVCFYKPETMVWIGRRYGWTLDRPHPRVALFGKPRP
jgi:hypothetical protein